MKILCLSLFIFLSLVCYSLVHCEESDSFDDYIRPVYKSPKPIGKTYFTATFDSVDDIKSWVKSKAKKDGVDSDLAKYDGIWAVEEAESPTLVGDLGLVLKSKARHHAIAAKLSEPFHFKGKPFVVQYEVKFQNAMECGGAYIKLITESPELQLSQFHDKTPFTIMFGPDKCGNDAKLHFIIRHKNPLTGEFEEKHAKRPSGMDKFFNDKKTHVFTLVVTQDNAFEIYVDQELVSSGSLLEDMEPPVNPPKEIDDPSDVKPEDWDEREKVVDESAVKPDDWDEDAPAEIVDEDAVMPLGWLLDESSMIPDPDAVKPADWDDDMDGDWEAPLINNPACESAPGCGEWKKPMKSNPEYRGKWSAPMIDNPNYKGIWKPRQIANPNYYEDLSPYKMLSIGAIGLELWSMTDGVLFDNFIISDSKDVAEAWADSTFLLKSAEEVRSAGSSSVVQAVLRLTNEKPWLWAVIVIVVGLPFVLLFVYFYNRNPSKRPVDIAAEAKKDDDLQGDTQESVGEESQEEDGTEVTKDSDENESGDEEVPDEAPVESKVETRRRRAPKE